MIRTVTANAAGIQIGDKTHNQDQVATIVIFRSLSVINKMANRPKNPMPDELEELF